MKDWTRDPTQCPVVEITCVKEFIAQHTSVDSINILFYKLFLLKSIYKYTTISLNLHIIKLSSILYHINSLISFKMPSFFHGVGKNSTFICTFHLLFFKVDGFTINIISSRIDYVHLPRFWRIMYCLNHNLQLWGFYLFVLANLHFHFTLAEGCSNTIFIQFYH